MLILFPLDIVQKSVTLYILYMYIYISVHKSMYIYSLSMPMGRSSQTFKNDTILPTWAELTVPRVVHSRKQNYDQKLSSFSKQLDF
jgi:hypothetical protein